MHTHYKGEIDNLTTSFLFQLPVDTTRTLLGHDGHLVVVQKALGHLDLKVIRPQGDLSPLGAAALSEWWMEEDARRRGASATWRSRRPRRTHALSRGITGAANRACRTSVPTFRAGAALGRPVAGGAPHGVGRRHCRGESHWMRLCWISST